MAGPQGNGVPEADTPRVVFKFGGTSVGSTSRFRTVIDILHRTAKTGRVVAVVSAQGKVTRRLSKGMEAFATGSRKRRDVVDDLVRDLRRRHLSQADDVLSDAEYDAYTTILDERLQFLRRVFDDVAREGFTPAARDAVLATGEQMSVPMVTLALRDRGLHAPHCEATALVVTDATYGEANVRLEVTRARIREWYETLAANAVPVVAGFVGATRDGTTTTLGFEGSDYSAALFARILDAGCLTRYTDVDGLYSEDPRKNEAAQRIDRLSMEEAFAMTESGRLGMHPKTLRPLVDGQIPMQVRSIEHPDGCGTQIIPKRAENVRLTPPVGKAVPVVGS